MKRIGFVVGLAIAATASAALAAEPSRGPYVSGALGLHMPSSTSATISGPTFPTREDGVKFEMGYALVGAIGYRFDALRAEIEVVYRNAGVDAVDGHQSAVSGSANLLFDIGIAEGIHPYIGGGLGIANTRWDSVQSGFGPNFHDESAKFQWQGILGAEMALNARTAVFVDYRFIGAFNNSFNSAPVATATASEVNSKSHNVMVGVRYNFMN